MNMNKVKTAELIGPALDWAVAEAEGVPIVFSKAAGFWRRADIPDLEEWSPSSSWEQGGPLIDKHNVEILRAGDCVMAKLYGLTNAAGDGKTPLIAACRAIVAAKLGDAVSVPEELVQQQGEGELKP